MSLKPQPVCPVPRETARVARAAYPKGSLCMQIRDVLGTIFTDEDFVDLFPKEGQPTDRAVAFSGSSPCCNFWRTCPIGKQRMR